MERMSSQVFGLILLAVAFAIFVPVGLFFLDPGAALFAVVLTVAFAAMAYVILRYDSTWAKAIALVVTIGAGATGAIYNAFGVFQVFSPVEFVGGLFTLFGFLFAVIGGIVALVKRRSSEPAGARSLKIRQAVLGVVGLGLVVSIVGFFLTRSSVAEAQAEGATVVDMGDFEFLPSTVSVDQGAMLLFTNSDVWAHDFTLEDYELYQYFGPGSEALVDVSALSAGTYVFFCSLHTFDGDGMVGTLTIES